ERKSACFWLSPSRQTRSPGRTTASSSRVASRAATILSRASLAPASRRASRACRPCCQVLATLDFLCQVLPGRPLVAPRRVRIVNAFFILAGARAGRYEGKPDDESGITLTD